MLVVLDLVWVLGVGYVSFVNMHVAVHGFVYFSIRFSHIDT